MKRLPTLDEFITEQILLEAGGQDAGKLELVQTSLSRAKEYVKDDLGLDVEKLISNFDKNYELAQSRAKLGWTQRQDMPVITDDDVKKLQANLKNGFIDVKKPFNKHGGENPFPDGLSGDEAEKWLENGLKDGSKSDDVINVQLKSVKVSELKPIQQQIYFDKGIEGIVKFGVDKSKNFYQNTFFITSNDNYIIDGHHRYLGAMLLDPDMKVKTISINLPIDILLPMTRSYGDAIGNKRNL